MNDIDRWLDRTGRSTTRAVSLYACLLTGKMFAYFRYRLRYALLLDATTFVLHVAEFLIILSSLGGLAAFTVMILRVGGLLVGGAWWGLLEVMRERLRAFARIGDRQSAQREIGAWLVLSVLVAGAATLMATALLVMLLPRDGNPVATLYAFLVIIEVALRLPVRVLHSGMYATRRIYRPLWSLFAPNLLQLTVLGLGVLYYPTAAVVLAIIVSNAVSIWITVHYTLRLYRLTGMSPNLAAARPIRVSLPSISLREGGEATLAGLGLRLDAVAVLVIAGIYGTNTRAIDLTAGLQTWREIDAFQFFYLVLPLFRGAYEATAVFYFDFVRLRRLPALREYRVWFFHRLLTITPVITAVFWALAVALGLFVLPGIPFSFLLALLPLFVVRGLIGTYQIRLFAEGRFRALNATVAVSAVLFLLVWLDPNPASDLVEITAAMIALLIVHINLQHFGDRIPPRPPQLPLGDWIRALAAKTGPVRVGTISIPEWIPSRQRRAAVETMRRTVADGGCLAFCSATTLIFYVDEPSHDEQAPHLLVQALTGGAANRGRYWHEAAAHGPAALDRIVADGWLQPVDGPPRAPASPEVLRAEFLQIFPGGFVANVQTRAGARTMRSLDPDLLVGLLPAAIRSLDDDALIVPVAGRWLSPIFHHNKVQVVFLLPPDPGPEQFRRWLRTLKTWRLGGWPAHGVHHVR